MSAQHIEAVDAGQIDDQHDDGIEPHAEDARFLFHQQADDVDRGDDDAG